MGNILETLTQEERKQFKIESFKKGTRIFFEDEICRRISIVIEGEIAIVSHTASGNTIYYNILHKDEMFGNNLIFSSDPTYKGHVTVLKDASLININKDMLKKLLMQNEKFMLKFFKINSDNAKELHTKIHILTIDSAKERLFFFLNEKNNIYKYSSISILAKELFIARETLSRLLTKLCNEGIIEITNKTIFLKK